MLSVNARGVYIKKEAAEDPRSMARIERMLPFIDAPTKPVIVDDAALAKLIADEGLYTMPRHGKKAEEVEPVVIFNQFLYHHTPEERAVRRKRFPDLFHPACSLDPYGGYGGFDWRSSGDAEYRCSTGLICQPAYAIHSFWGCHFRCTYCNLGHVANVFVNVEDWIDHIRTSLVNLDNAPNQNLFQWDNGTDIVCWEPEYGGTKMLVELFAEQPDKYLELYVGKSDNVDFMLDYDHGGHTVCCWSLSTDAQCRALEPRTASMEERIMSARKCQDAGYGIRIRLSPMTPVVGWEAETRHMLQRLFAEVSPDVMTIEPLRFLTYEELCREVPDGVLDPEFLNGMRDIPADADDWQKQQFPEELRVRMYRVALDETRRLSPETPVALCREKRGVWDQLRGDFERMGQDPDDYVCNCGSVSAGRDPRLVKLTR
jgi:spore photoproduct lyase-like protein